MDKKAILWPVIVSVLIHVTLLVAAGMVDLRENIKPVDVISVSIKEPEPEEKPSPKKEIIIKEKKKSTQTQKEKGAVINSGDWREETIDLGTSDIKYVNYLSKVKNKILQIWKYPQRAYERNEEGDVVVKMSIDADGSLSGVVLMSSSGSEALDEGALSVVQAAAPFEPLPEFYNLSRLHIVASFDYKITD